MTEASSETPTALLRHSHSGSYHLLCVFTLFLLVLYRQAPRGSLYWHNPRSVFGFAEFALNPKTPKTNPVLKFPLKGAVPAMMRKQAKQNQSFSGFLYQQQCFFPGPSWPVGFTFIISVNLFHSDKGLKFSNSGCERILAIYINCISRAKKL